jgi:hypothetical protein
MFSEFTRGVVLNNTFYLDIRDEDLVAANEAIDLALPDLLASNPKLLPRLELGSSPEADLAQALLTASASGDRAESIEHTVRMVLPRMLRDLLNGLADTVEGEISRLRYLGPLRSFPPRHLAFSVDHDLNWYAGGGYAWDILRRDEEVRRAVNTWLSSAERLSTPYEVILRRMFGEEGLITQAAQAINSLYREIFARDLRLMSSEASPELMDRLQSLRNALTHGSTTNKNLLDEVYDLVSGIYPDADELATSWIETLASELEYRTEVALLDRRTDTVVSHRDVGIGISQVLPVLVYSYASRGQLLAIEQPEIHLCQDPIFWSSRYEST